MEDYDISQIKAFFKETDLDGNGVISFKEMGNVFRAIGDWSEEELQELFAEADSSGDGKLQYDEFLNWVMQEEVDVEEARENVAEVAEENAEIAAEVAEENNDAEGDAGEAEEPADEEEPPADEAEAEERADSAEERSEAAEPPEEAAGEEGAGEADAEEAAEAEAEAEEDAAEAEAEAEEDAAEAEAEMEEGGEEGAEEAAAAAEEAGLLELQAEEAAAEDGAGGGAALDLSTCSLEEVLQSGDSEKLMAFWQARRSKIKKEGNIAIGKSISCESSFDNDFCGPVLMITGNGCDANKWIGAEGTESHRVLLTFPLPAQITELFVVWGSCTFVKDFSVSAMTAEDEEIVVADFGTVISPEKSPSSLPGDLSLSYVKPEATLENVKSLILTIYPEGDSWVSVCDLVVHGDAPVPPPPPPAIECDCIDVIDPLRKGAPCEVFQEDGAAAPAVSKKSVMLTDGIAAVDAINAACEEAGAKFVDRDFPADDTSVWGDGTGELGDSARGADAEKEGPAGWKRLCQMSPDAKLFKGGIDMNDVQQGAVGDCWLISVIASLACVPEHLKGLIYPQEFNPYGVYAVRFYSTVTSEWSWILVDDLTPMDPFDSPYFMKAQDPQEIWPIIMEKAFAKVNSCYSGLNPGVACGGTCAMRMVSGNDEVLSWVGKDFDGHDVDAVWEEICKAVDAGCAAACGVADENWGKHSNAEMDEIGVVFNHVFSCVGRYALEDGTRLLRLRNPWGEGGEWKGPWSDKSEEWTEERRTEVPDYTDKNDGTFFITVEDFWEYWFRLEICYLKPLVPLAKLIEGKRGQA